MRFPAIGAANVDLTEAGALIITSVLMRARFVPRQPTEGYICDKPAGRSRRICRSISRS